MFWSPDELSLVISVHGFSQCIIKLITNGSIGATSADLGEVFPIAKGRELAASIRVTPQPGQMFPPGPPRHLDPVEDAFCFHV